jgi:hypothetical protein
VLEPIAGVECRRRFSSIGRGEYSYDVELYASAKMFAFASVLSFEAPSSSLSCNLLNKVVPLFIYLFIVCFIKWLLIFVS